MVSTGHTLASVASYRELPDIHARSAKATLRESQVAAYGLDVLKHLVEVTSDGDLFYRVVDFSVFNQKPLGRQRKIAADAVRARVQAFQLLDQQAVPHILKHLFQFRFAPL